jgi:hypothetical protein
VPLAGVSSCKALGGSKVTFRLGGQLEALLEALLGVGPLDCPGTVGSAVAPTEALDVDILGWFGQVRGKI